MAKITELIAQLEAERQKTLDFLKHLPDCAVDREFDHPFLGKITLGALLDHMVGHDAIHQGQIYKGLRHAHYPPGKLTRAIKALQAARGNFLATLAAVDDWNRKTKANPDDDQSWTIEQVGQHILTAEQRIRESIEKVAGWITPARFYQGYRWEEYLQDIEVNVEKFKDNYKAAEQELSAEDKDFFAGYDKPIKVLALAEDWCGDVVQSLPPIVRTLGMSKQIELRLFKRDRDVDITYQYLTNGTRSIPKLAFFDRHFNQFATWGPRPAACQKIMTDNKGKIPMEEIYPQIRAWYQEHGNQDLIRELREILAAHTR